MASYCTSPWNLCNGGEGKKIELNAESTTATCVDLTAAHCEAEEGKKWTQFAGEDFGSCEDASGMNNEKCPGQKLVWDAAYPDGACVDLVEDDCTIDEEWFQPEEGAPFICIDPGYDGCAPGEDFQWHSMECTTMGADDCDATEVWYEPAGTVGRCVKPAERCSGTEIYEEGAGCRDRTEDECNAMVSDE